MSANDQPDFLQIHRDRAEAARALNRLDVCEQELRELIALSPEDGAAFASLADCRFDRGDPREAIALATRAMELAPTNSYVLNVRARVGSGGTLLDDVRLAEEAIELNPRHHYGWYMLSLRRIARGDILGAREAAEQCLALAPDDSGGLKSLARSQFLLSAIDEGRDATQRLLALDPESAQGHQLMGDFLLKDADYAAALPHLAAAVRLAPAEIFRKDRYLNVLEKTNRYCRLLVMLTADSVQTTWRRGARYNLGLMLAFMILSSISHLRSDGGPVWVIALIVFALWFGVAVLLRPIIIQILKRDVLARAIFADFKARKYVWKRERLPEPRHPALRQPAVRSQA